MNANAFASTFYFFSIHKATALKNKKSLQANAPYSEEINASLTQHKHGQTEARTDNMGLASCGVKCLNSCAVFQFNFSAGLTVLCPEIPHERQAQKRKLQFFYTQWI